MSYPSGKGQIDRDKNIYREIERDRDRQINRDREIDREKQRERDSQRQSQREREGIEIEFMYVQIDRWIDKLIDRQKNR